MEEFANKVLSSFEKTCPVCGKKILVACSDNWAYKIKYQGGGIKYFCGYSHWLQEKNKKDRNKRTNQEAYWERMRQKKNRENKKRRERNGSTTNA
jgi:hypothetical protein